MTPWMTIGEEARAVQRSAARARCRVLGMQCMQSAGSPARLRVQLECADGWAASRLLLGLAIEDSLTAGARDFALSIRRRQANDAEFAMALQEYVQEAVAFVREQGEVFGSSWYTLTVKAGDCDDHARLMMATLRAAGVPAGLAFFYSARARAAGPSHVCPVVFIAGKPVYVETTIRADFGEHPFDAALRLGVIHDRKDIATEVLIMSERELPSLPAGFLDRNPIEQIQKDAKQLQGLGFLCDASQVSNAGDPVFRTAILAFQLAHGLEPDGLVGPATRNTLEAVTMGDTAAPVEVKSTPQLSPGFFRGVRDMAARFNAQGAALEGEDFLAVWLAESGIKQIANLAGEPAYGINQLFAPKSSDGTYPALRAIGFNGTPQEYLALTPEEALPYVERYYVKATGGNLRVLRGVDSLYLVNFTPAYIGHAAEPDYVIAGKNGPNAKIYEANHGLDYQGKGTIVVSDLKAFVGRAQRNAGSYWIEARRRYYAESGDDGSNTVPRSIGGAVATGIILAVSAGLATYITATS